MRCDGCSLDMTSCACGDEFFDYLAACAGKPPLSQPFDKPVLRATSLTRRDFAEDTPDERDDPPDPTLAFLSVASSTRHAPQAHSQADLNALYTLTNDVAFDSNAETTLARATTPINRSMSHRGIL